MANDVRGYIDFNCDYWCAFCGRKVPKGQEKYDSLGRPVDWKCGHLLRYKVRNKNQGRDKTDRSFLDRSKNNRMGSRERGKELAELMSNRTFVYGAETARKWLALLREWQKATRPV